MVLTPSTMQLSLGAAAPDFALPDPDGKIHSLGDFAGRPALLVAFLCNHCPYVKHVAPAFAQLAKEYQGQGLGVVAINSNDFEHYPDDSPAKMKQKSPRVAIPFLISSMSRSRSPRSIGPHVRPTSISSTPTGNWSIAARWTPAVRATTCPSPARTSAMRSMPSWPAGPSQRTSGPASAATSSGGRGTNRNIPADFGVDVTGNCLDRG